MTWSDETRDLPGFRLRGPEVTRLESFSDVVFGFALTLLVVSLESFIAVGEDGFLAIPGKELTTLLG